MGIGGPPPSSFRVGPFPKDEAVSDTVLGGDFLQDQINKTLHIVAGEGWDILHKAGIIGIEEGSESAALLGGSGAALELAVGDGGRLRTAQAVGTPAPARLVQVLVPVFRLHAVAEHGDLAPRTVRVRWHVVLRRELAWLERYFCMGADVPLDHAVTHPLTTYLFFLLCVCVCVCVCGLEAPATLPCCCVFAYVNCYHPGS